MSYHAINWALTVPASPTQKHVLLVLANFANDQGVTWPSPELLVKATGLSDRAIRNAKKVLTEKGLIATAPEMGRFGIRLALNINVIETEPRSEKQEPRSEKNRNHIPKKRNVMPNKRNVVPIHIEPLITNIEPLYNPPKGSLPSLPEWLPREAWDGWMEMRQRKRVPTTQRAIALTVRKLDEFRKQGHDVGDILDSSTERGWTGVFAPKPQTQNQHQATRTCQPKGRTDFSDLMDWEPEPIPEVPPEDRKILIEAGILRA